MSGEPIYRVATASDRAHLRSMDRLSELTGLAWLCERAGYYEAEHGNPAWSAQLLREAAMLREMAVNG